jgi:hypothetical protein
MRNLASFHTPFVIAFLVFVALFVVVHVVGKRS